MFVYHLDMLRILCLHGYTQNAYIFRQRTGVLRKVLKSVAELVFINAPYTLEKPEGMEAFDSDADIPRTWWKTGEIVNGVAPYHGVQESIDYIFKIWKEQGPFDGILGFSQGAGMAGLLCAMWPTATSAPIPDPKFAILISGFIPRDPTLHHYYKSIVTMPSLHVIGKTDTIVSDERTLALLNAFAPTSQDIISSLPIPTTETIILQVGSATALFHPGGHFIPAAAPHRLMFKNFVSQFYQGDIPSAPTSGTATPTSGIATPDEPKM